MSPVDNGGEILENVAPMWRRGLWVLSIPILIFVIYANGLHAPFAYDDWIHILQNEAVTSFRSILDPDSLKRLVDPQVGLAGRPLLLATYGITYSNAGPEPSAFRLTNILIHVVNSILVFLIASELARN